MSIDKLQEKIRKMKNPSMVDFSLDLGVVPPHIIQAAGDPVYAYEQFARELLLTLKNILPAVRFSMGSYTLLGPDGLMLLRRLCEFAKELGYYVLLDGPDCFSPQSAENAAKILFSSACLYAFDGILLSAYAGSDVLKPYVKRIAESGKDVFVVLRTANKSAAGHALHNHTCDIFFKVGIFRTART